MSQHPICHTMLESLMILLFEAFGTGMLAMLFISAGVSFNFFIGFFILLILSARISGSHYNPIVTLAFMLRKDAGQFNKWLGILYMLFQLGGAILGTMMGFYCFRQGETFLSLTEHDTKLFQFMFSDCLGSFILVLAYLTQTEEKYKLSEDAAITLMIISAAYLVGMALCYAPGGGIIVLGVMSGWWTASPLNPAISLSIITFATFDGNISEMHYAWAYLVTSWGGSLLAVLCYEFGFKKFQNTVEKQDDAAELQAEDGANEIAQPMLE